MKKTAAALIVSGLTLCAASVSAWSAPANSPRKFCRFTVRLPVINEVKAASRSYFTGNQFWDGQDGEVCEVSVRAQKPGSFTTKKWLLLTETQGVQQVMGDRYVSAYTLPLSETQEFNSAELTCRRESETAMPEAWTLEQMLQRASRILQCIDEPPFAGLATLLSKCELETNYWQADLRQGHPIAADKIAWMNGELRKLELELAAKCPDQLDLPSCNSAREVLACLNGLKRLPPGQAISGESQGSKKTDSGRELATQPVEGRSSRPAAQKLR